MTRIPLIRVKKMLVCVARDLAGIAEMGLSVRTTNCLEETGILTVRDLLNATPRRLLAKAILVKNHGGLRCSGRARFLPAQS